MCRPSEPQPLSSLIEENSRRLAAIAATFRPLTGEGGGGARFELPLDEAEGGRLWLPAAMERFPLVARLRRSGSLAAAAASAPKPAQGAYELGERLVRERIRHDFPFWAAAFVRIKRKGGGADVPFVLNRPQRRLVAVLEGMRLAGEPMRLILLKARQWGGSTCVQLYMAWLQLVHRQGLNSLIIAHQGAGSDEIRDMFVRMLRAYPVRLLYPRGVTPDPGVRKMEGVGRSGAIFRVPRRNCKIKIGTAERPDSCRGGDYNLVHLSEVGIWRASDGKKPEDIVRSACGGVLLAPMTLIVLESTANGTGNFFHREYLAASRGESQFRPMFVSWYEIDQYSLPFATETGREAFAARLYENRLDTRQSDRRQSGAYMWRLWERGATLEALHWYEAERMKYSTHAGMASEYPSDDIEAFAHSGLRVFAPEAVERLRRGCRPADRRGVIDAPMRDGFPELSAVEFKDDTTGALQIWETPDPPPAPKVSHRYLTVVDIGGRSSRADWSVITVFDRLFMAEGEPPAVVAQWRGHADLDVVAAEAAKIAAFYENSLLVIESNTVESRSPEVQTDAGALPFVMALLRDHYPNLYMRRRSPEDVRDGVPAKYGFHTNAATKPMVIASLVKAVRDAGYIERDAMALDELLQYEQRPGGSYGAVAGCHDDILMTRAIGLYICFHEMPLPVAGSQKQNRTRREPGLLTESSFF